MALEFTAATNEFVNHGADTSHDSLTTGTTLAWVYPYNFNGDMGCWHKYNGSTEYMGFTVKSAGTANMRFDLSRSTLDLTMISDSDPMTQNAWNFIGASWNTGGADANQELWYGSLSSVVIEAASYNLQRVGSGTVQQANTQSLYAGNVGNGGTTAGVWDGEIAFIAIYDTVLTVGQMAQQQFNLAHPVTSGCVLFCNYGFNGTSTQADWSGNLNNGSVTGATVAPHVPTRYAPAVSRGVFPTAAAVYDLDISVGYRRGVKVV